MPQSEEDITEINEMTYNLDIPNTFLLISHHNFWRVFSLVGCRKAKRTSQTRTERGSRHIKWQYTKFACRCVECENVVRRVRDLREQGPRPTTWQCTPSVFIGVLHLRIRQTDGFEYGLATVGPIGKIIGLSYRI